MNQVPDIGTLIVRSPDIRGGRPRMAGTGVTVRRVVGWYRLGLNAEEIAARIGRVSVGQIYAALAYYHANRGEIDADLATEEVFVGGERNMEHTAIQEPAGFADLPKVQQIRYLQALWDRIADQPSEIPVPESHLELVEERLADYRRDPGRARSAYEILDRLANEPR